MSLTSLSDRKTPGRPIEVTFDPELGTPSANQTVLLIGKKHATSGTEEVYEVAEMANVADLEAAVAEAEEKYGAGSELALMVEAAVKANEGQSSFPALKCCALASDDTDFGDALTAVKRVRAEFVVSPFDGVDESELRTELRDACAVMSGAERVENDQCGTFGVVFNRNESAPADLPAVDTQYLFPCWLPDSGSPDYGVAEMAAACAARAASQGSPFLPLDNVVIGGLVAPEAMSDWPTVGAGLESDAALDNGWTPLRVTPNGDVAFVRTVTGRTTVDGTVEATAYYDLQDFQVLYFFRRTVFARLNQSDLKRVKASLETAKAIKAEVIRLMKLFETQNMFQNVDKLAPLVQVERSSSDRHRFDMRIPVNVIPGLHVVATNIAAGTLFDSFSV